MFIKNKFTEYELEMLNGWQGQLSDGLGEDSTWCIPYCLYLKFDKNGITIDENQKPFCRFKTEKDIMEDICDRFIEISEQGMKFDDVCRLYFKDDDRQKNIFLGRVTANSIIKKLGGIEDFYCLDDCEEDDF